jgi:hypothetical protein
MTPRFVSGDAFHALVDASPLGIAAFDREGRVMIWNRAAERITGWPAEEAVGRVNPVCDEESIPAFRELVARGFRGETWSDLELRRRRRDGVEIVISASSAPLRDERGEIVGVCSYFGDVTAASRDQAALREATEKLTALFESSPVAIVTYDRAGIVTSWNAAAERLFGWTAEEAVGGFSPLNDETREEFLGYMTRALRGESWSSIEISRRRKDGPTVEVSASSAPLRDGHGEIVGMVSFYLDVTARRRADAALQRAEARYRALVEQLPLVVYVDSLDDRLTSAYVSPRITDLVGYTQEEWRDDPGLFERSLHPEDRERVLAELFSALAENGRFSGDYRLVGKDGRVVWVHDEEVVLRAEDGRPLYAQGFCLDITARKEAEAEVQRQNEQLRELDRLKDEFVALVSHELRTPLTSILGYLDLVLDGDVGPLTEAQERFLHVIERNGDRLRRLVGDLLFVAQLDAGRLRLEPAPVDVVSLAREAVEAASPAAAANGVSIRLEETQVPPLWADRARLGQLLDNLLSNAVKFTPEGGRVDVHVRRRNGSVRLEISDTGVGIPPEELPLVFERFFRAESASRGAVQGTGLGLAIAKAIAESHGGSIGAESAEGAGSTFWVEIPLRVAAEGGDQRLGDDLHRAARDLARPA